MKFRDQIQGNKIVPRLADRYLARNGYESQQIDEPEDPSRPNNLWKPVMANHGAHGDFAARAHRWSCQLWSNENRDLVALVALSSAAALLPRGALRGSSSEPRDHSSPGRSYENSGKG